MEEVAGNGKMILPRDPGRLLTPGGSSQAVCADDQFLRALGAWGSPWQARCSRCTWGRGGPPCPPGSACSARRSRSSAFRRHARA